ncbi:hypothetical protein ACVWZM_006959 [Bradyrhizobium sp. USDA 4501]
MHGPDFVGTRSRHGQPQKNRLDRLGLTNDPGQAFRAARRNGFASGTIRGSAEQMPSTSLMISQRSAFSAAAIATAAVSPPPRPSVVIP